MNVMCSWCHGMNSENGLALTPYCLFCGHRADVPRADCDCPKCWKPVDGVDEPGTPMAELLAAARAMLQEADTFHDDTAHYVEVRRSAVEALRAAIAKAEGR